MVNNIRRTKNEIVELALSLENDLPKEVFEKLLASAEDTQSILCENEYKSICQNEDEIVRNLNLIENGLEVITIETVFPKDKIDLLEELLEQDKTTVAEIVTGFLESYIEA